MIKTLKRDKANLGKITAPLAIVSLNNFAGLKIAPTLPEKSHIFYSQPLPCA